MKKLWSALFLTLISVGSAFADLPFQGDRNLIAQAQQTDLDYNQLEQMLATGRWREANDKTIELILRATRRYDQGWFSKEHIDKIDCSVLKTIDDLWTQYSDGHFGFSPQVRIFIETGNKPGRLINEEAYQDFGLSVGWRSPEEWLFESFENQDYIYNYLPNVELSSLFDEPELTIIDETWTDSVTSDYYLENYQIILQDFISMGTENNPSRTNNNPLPSSSEEEEIDDKFDNKFKQEFVRRLGWRTEEDWIPFKQNLNYSLNAPEGHLPFLRDEYEINGARLKYVFLFEKLNKCNIGSVLQQPNIPNELYR